MLEWCIAVFEAPNRFRQDQAMTAARDIVANCKAVGTYPDRCSEPWLTLD